MGQHRQLKISNVSSGRGNAGFGKGNHVVRGEDEMKKEKQAG